MMASVVAYGSNGTKDTKKDESQKTKKEQVDSNKKDTSEQESTTVEQNQEEVKEKSAISNFSFNYLFYLIYKIKYADIFKLPSRNNEDARSSSWSGVNLNKLYQRLSQPSL